MSFYLHLVNPPGSSRKSNITMTNLGIATLTAYMEKHNKNCQVVIVDARHHNFSPEEAFQEIVKKSVDMVGVSMFSFEASSWVRRLVDLLKHNCPSVHVTLGNYFPSLCPQKAFFEMDGIDSIVIGEGEITLNELVTSLQNNREWRTISGIAFRDQGTNKIKITPKQKLIKNLDDLSWPVRYLAHGDGSSFDIALEGSRGCYYGCKFCAIPSFYRLSEGVPVRVRSAEHLIEEMISLKKRYPKLKNFFFADPDFLVSTPADRERLLKFALLVAQNLPGIHFYGHTRPTTIIQSISLLKELKKAGLAKIYLGIEAATPNILKNMNKRTTIEENIHAAAILKELGIDFTYGFMMITPWTLDSDIEENLKYLEKIGHVGFHNLFHEMTIIPGTPAFQDFSDTDELSWYGHAAYYTYKTKSLHVEHLRKIRDSLEKHFPRCFANMSFVYESVRQIRKNGNEEFAQQVEAIATDLALEIFEYCWDNAKLMGEETNYKVIASRCFAKYSIKIDSLLKAINPNIPVPCPLDQLADGVLACQA